MTFCRAALSNRSTCSAQNSQSTHRRPIQPRIAFQTSPSPLHLRESSFRRAPRLGSARPHLCAPRDTTPSAPRPARPRPPPTAAWSGRPGSRPQAQLFRARPGATAPGGGRLGDEAGRSRAPRPGAAPAAEPFRAISRSAARASAHPRTEPGLVSVTGTTNRLCPRFTESAHRVGGPVKIACLNGTPFRLGFRLARIAGLKGGSDLQAHGREREGERTTKRGKERREREGERERGLPYPDRGPPQQLGSVRGRACRRDAGGAGRRRGRCRRGRCRRRAGGSPGAASLTPAADLSSAGSEIARSAWEIGGSPGAASLATLGDQRISRRGTARQRPAAGGRAAPGGGRPRRRTRGGWGTRGSGG